MAGLLSLLAGPVLDKVLDLIPDPNERARAREQAERELAAAEDQRLKNQTDINKKEAEHSSMFVAGWRPFLGWACGAGLVVPSVIIPTLTWVAQVVGVEVPPAPVIDTAVMMNLLVGMLGLGGLRTTEKIKGVAR
jgi:hypothetical protein